MQFFHVCLFIRFYAFVSLRYLNYNLFLVKNVWFYKFMKILYPSEYMSFRYVAIIPSKIYIPGKLQQKSHALKIVQKIRSDIH